MRLKLKFSVRPKCAAQRGNWGGFSFEIETSKAPNADKRDPRGNWVGFSFEIETMLSSFTTILESQWQLGRLLV